MVGVVGVVGVVGEVRVVGVGEGREVTQHTVHRATQQNPEGVCTQQLNNYMRIFLYSSSSYSCTKLKSYLLWCSKLWFLSLISWSKVGKHNFANMNFSCIKFPREWHQNKEGSNDKLSADMSWSHFRIVVTCF